MTCWGRNYFGESSPPAKTQFTQLGIGSYHTCGILPDGQLECFGYDSHGMVSKIPSQDILPPQYFTAGDDISCAVLPRDTTSEGTEVFSSYITVGAASPTDTGDTGSGGPTLGGTTLFYDDFDGDSTRPSGVLSQATLAIQPPTR